MKRIYPGLFTLALFILSVGCKQETTEPDVKPDTKTAKLVAKDYSRWTYFSFKTGDSIPGINETNFKERSDWDIAFHSYDVRLNGGASGKGKAGVVKLNTEDFNSVTQAPESGYVVDKEEKVIVAIKSTGPVEENQPMNKTLDWLKFEVITPPNYTFTLRKNVYIVRTAEGKYAKVQFTTYLNDKGERVYPTFNYVYQADGSRKF